MQGLGGGTAVVIGLAAIQAVEKQPQFLPQLVGAPVLMFAFGVVFLCVQERGRREDRAVNMRSAIGLEQLATGVHALASKDDQRYQRERENDVLIDHIAKQNEKILAHLERR